LTKKFKCEKCGEATDNNHFVHPIDKYGRNLDGVPLCSNCLEKWGEYYNSNVVKNSLAISVSSGKFQKVWAEKWEKFMRGKYDKEKVEFT